MNTKLFNALMKWDRWGGEYKKELYLEFSTHKNFAKDTVEIFETEPLLRFQTAWLLRQFLEQKNILPETLLKTILSKIDELEHWWSQASILRIITLGIKTKELANLAETFVRKNLDSKKIVIKALSIEAFAALALINFDSQEEAIKICKNGLKSNSAAIFVKSRNALKKLKK